ncbi:MAG: ATP-binding protein [Limisphaerales bacterium]
MPNWPDSHSREYFPVNKPKDKFRVSSALKTIIGRELITDDFVAVFELVKNAFDAHARNVEIRFEGLHTDSPKLIIKDNGKGMTEDDVDGKWLFVAYSAKTDGTEDSPEGKPKDYRDKIRTERTFAGAKGIGRFSCDRLGRYLNLYTRAQSSGPYEHLQIDWQDFEEDSSKEFVNVAIKRSSPATIPYELDSGTIIEISKPQLSDLSPDEQHSMKRSDFSGCGFAKMSFVLFAGWDHSNSGARLQRCFCG